jgi:hypothetical protein
MTTAVVLREPEATALQNLVQRTGRSADELVREAVQQYIQRYTFSDRHALLQQARGMWQHRDDLPSLAELRREFERRAK